MLFKLLTLPIKGVIAVGRKVEEEADRELYDLNYIQQELINIEIMYERHEISEEFYKVKEEDLINRYTIAKERELGEWDLLEDEED